MKHVLLPFVCCVLFLGGCDDLLEEDLDGFGVVLLTPPDGYSTASNLVAFQWEPVPRDGLSGPDRDAGLLEPDPRSYTIRWSPMRGSRLR
ncbi:MAG: hypothetical protein IPH05_03505 [Flavobacteriales bacterium]|nr:hypothetical protein [Flavobacteriales bacterium]